MTSTDIPIEVLSSQILSRLPAKSVLRFRCVSKQWYSLLTSQSFKNKHLDLITDNLHQNPNIILQISGREFHSIDCEIHEDSVLVTQTRPLPFISRQQKVVILASFHGLVCAGVINKRYSRSHYSDLYLWNPLTDEFKRLSKVYYHKDCYTVSYQRCGLYYSSSDNDYKFLSVRHNDDSVYIYSLKNDSWRNMSDATNSLKKTSRFRSCESWSQCNWLNDNLFFIKEGYPIDRRNEPSYSMSYSILKFDTKTEKFTEIVFPFFYIEIDQIFTSYFLTVQRDKLHLSVKYGIHKYNVGCIETCIKVWSDEERWTDVETYRLKSGVITSFRPLHLMRNKNWLMLDYKYKYYEEYFSREYSIYVVNFDEKSNRSRGDDDDGTSLYRLVKRGFKPQKVRYIETLVSPNQFLNEPKFHYRTKKKVQ